VGEGTEGLGQEGIAYKEGCGLTKCNVGSWLASSLVIVVHAGHVIVNQRVGMNQLNSGSDVNQVFCDLASDTLTGCDCEQRSNALAACPQWVQRCLLKWGWPRIDEARLEAAVDSVSMGGTPIREFHLD
jgi:hypothetical protein